MFRSRVFSATLFATTAWVPASAYAQSAASASDQEAGSTTDNQLGDIVVTARKVSENLQDVPVAVTAFSGEQLEAQNASQLTDIAKLTPGLVIRPSASGPAQAVFQIRGQFQNDTVATLDPSVGVYVDGYYIARAYGINSDLVDVQSVQTLKGPQGTLFGRNTTGGAILIQTNDPDADQFSGLVSATYGRFDERAATGVINVPILTDRIALRAAVQVRKRDGYVRERLSGRDVGNQDSWTGRIKLLVNATDNLSFLLSGEVFESDFAFNPYRLAYVSPTSAANLAAGIALFGPGPTGTRFGQGSAALASEIALNSSSDSVANSRFSSNDVKTQTYTGTTTLETFFGAVKFIGGYRKIDSTAQTDIDGSSFVIVDSVLTASLEQYSGELQFTGKAFNDAVDFAAGLFYFKENGRDGSVAMALTAINPNNPNVTDGLIDTRSQGLYGQATWHISDALSFTGGLRYSVEDKGLTLRNRSFNAAQGLFLCSLPTTRPDCGATRSDSFSAISYTAGLDYRLSEEILTYAKISRGFRSGGQNLRSSGTLSSFVPFRPEIVTTYEGGVKAQFLDNRGRFNAAGYYSRINEIQRSTLVTSPSGQTATIVGNAGKAQIWGAEAELTLAPVPGLELAGTAAYTKPKYISYIDPNTGDDRSNEPFDNVAKWTFSTSATYTHEFDFGRFSLRGDYSYQGRTPLQAYAGPNAAITAATTMKPVGLLGARASLTLLDGTLDLAVFGRNLTNNRTPNVAIYLPAPIDLVAVQYREPRTFGVSATVRFGG